MDIQIKTIEDLSLNAWPSHQIQIYDGWLLRFSYFYTHRTNCVEQIGASAISLEEKISYCENEYAKWGTPVIFKISPLVPDGFDSILEKRGYVIEHKIHNMFLNLADKYETATQKPLFVHDIDDPISVNSFIPPSWIDALFQLKGTTNIMHKTVVPSMYQAIPKETICISLHLDGAIVGTGLGILDRDYIGVYAIHVAPQYRRMGYARRIVERILQEGFLRGAKYSYLQVVSENEAAISLYESIGFTSLYTDWFRVFRHN